MPPLSMEILSNYEVWLSMQNDCPQTHGINGVTDGNCPYCNPRSLADSSTLAAEYKQIIDQGGPWVQHRVAKELFEACEHMHQVVLSQRNEIEDLEKRLEFAASGLGVVERRRDELKVRIAELENEKTLLRAQAEAAASLMRDVQRDCVRLRGALKRYSKHELGPEFEKPCLVYTSAERCTCGLSELLGDPDGHG